jgi:hypothetical protein
MGGAVFVEERLTASGCPIKKHLLTGVAPSLSPQFQAKVSYCRPFPGAPMRLFIALTIPCIFTGCTSLPILPEPQPEHEMKWYFDKEAMKAEILEFIPIGMPLDDAKKVIEKNGFSPSVWHEKGSQCLLYMASYKGMTLFDWSAQWIWCFLYYEKGSIKKVEVYCVSYAPFKTPCAR